MHIVKLDIIPCHRFDEKVGSFFFKTNNLLPHVSDRISSKLRIPQKTCTCYSSSEDISLNCCSTTQTNSFIRTDRKVFFPCTVTVSFTNDDESQVLNKQSRNTSQIKAGQNILSRY